MVRLAVLAAALAAASCSNVITRKYEYEEDVYLDLDGSATVYVNAAVPALVALRDAPLPIDPAARLDRNDVRAWFEGPGARVASVSTSRREGRRYVHLRIETDDIRTLSNQARTSLRSSRAAGSMGSGASRSATSAGTAAFT
jgi:hypothetical protein